MYHPASEQDIIEKFQRGNIQREDSSNVQGISRVRSRLG